MYLSVWQNEHHADESAVAESAGTRFAIVRLYSFSGTQQYSSCGGRIRISFKLWNAFSSSKIAVLVE